MKIKQTGATGVFLGGLICENGGKLVKDLRSGLGADVKILAPDGFTPVSAVVKGSVHRRLFVLSGAKGAVSARVRAP